MGKIIVVMVFVIIMQFAIKKDYKELLVFLIKFLILDWIFVSVFSRIPFVRTIVFLFGEPMLSVLIYAIIELICMGIFYYAMQKCNTIISLVVYLVINLIIGKFYTTISGSIVLDLLFNFIIGIIIIIIYQKSLRMEDIEYFAIIGMVINAILALAWKIGGGMIILYIWIYGTLFSPYIIGGILSAIIIRLIRKKVTEKNKGLIYAVIIIFCVSVGHSTILYLSAKPDKVYTKMKKINDSERLIGLSKDEVVALLGEPLRKYDDCCVYDAGMTTCYLLFGGRDFYDFFIRFDENDKVKSTEIEINLPPGG